MISNQNPVVSICIPVYNGEKFIAATIQSALAQDFSDFELIVSDNASTDNTQAAVESLTDPRIRYCRSDINLGPVGNFNRCLDLASGRYIKILCADDLLYPTSLTRQVTVLANDHDKKIALVSCRRDIIDGQGRVRMRPRNRNFSGQIPASEAIRRSVRSGTNIFGEPQAVLFRTEQGRQAGGFNPAHGFCLDLDFWFRLLELGDLYYIDEPLCAFRVSGTSWSTGLAGQQADEFKRFLDEWSLRATGYLSVSDRRAGVRKARLNAYFRRLFYLWLSATK